jgi:hypothetical protein
MNRIVVVLVFGVAVVLAVLLGTGKFPSGGAPPRPAEEIVLPEPEPTPAGLPAVPAPGPVPAVPAPPPAPAGGRIEGRAVHARSGLPVAGAAVWCVEADHDVFLDSVGPRGAPSARADGDGRFVLDGLAPGAYGLLVAAEGLAPGRAEGVAVRAGEVSDAGAVALGEGGAIEGIVRGDDGAPAPGERVIVSRVLAGVETFGDAGLEVPSGADGRYRAGCLAPGRYRVWLARGEALSFERTMHRPRPEAEDDPSVMEVAEGETVFFDLFRTDFGEVLGTVADPDRRPLRLTVNLVREGAGEPLPRVAKPDASGAYAFRGLVPGRYALVLAGQREEFEIARGERRRVDVTVAVGRIEGVVVDVSGRAAAGVEVEEDRLDFARDGWLTGRPEPVVTDARGRFFFEGLCPGRYRVAARGAEGEGASGEIALGPGGEDRGVRIELSPVVSLVVQVVDGAGAVLPGVWVGWSQGEAHGGEQTDGSGRARLRARPGRLFLTVRPAGDANASEATSEVVVGTEADQSVRVTLE